MSNPKDGQRKWHVAAVILLGFLSLLTAPSPATANSYHDFLCRIPYGASVGRAAPADGVTYVINNDFIYAEDTCSSGGSLYAQMVGETTHPFATEASNTFTAPAGLTISRFVLWRYEADLPGQPYGTPASNLTYRPGGPISVQGLCTEGCTRGTPADPLSSANVVSVPELSGVKEIQWSAACGGGPGGECPATGAAGTGSLSSQYDVYAADIDLVDDTPPAVSNVGGPLVAGGTLSGQQAISFNASDGQSGVYGGSLVVDGHTIVSQILNTNSGACQSLNLTSDGQRSFEYAQPCPPSVSAGLTLNTSLLAAGQHSLELIVEDAAGNRDIAYNGTITTSGPSSISVNGGLIRGGLTSSTPAHIANGDPCAGEALELAVNGKRKPPVIPYGKSVMIRGVLHCGAVPIRDARVAIATLGGPASAALDTSVQTALDGSFSYKVPTGPDRTLRFSYTAYSDDPGPSATATATLMISPRITLRIKPHRTSNRHTIYWTGSVSGGPYPQQGVTLDVEVKEGRHWKIFDQVVANRKGQFRYSYRFHATEESTTYTFRASLPDTGAQDYPYTHGASNTVKVHVDP
jgi:hypothetical protein